MAQLIDYFVAPDDAAAVKAVQGLPSDLPATDGTGIEPTVVLAVFEEMLTGRAFEQILDDPGAYEVVASADEGELLIIRLPQELTQALVAAPDERLGELAGPWSEIEEFWGQGDPAALTDFLARLKQLARQPGAVYSRVSL